MTALSLLLLWAGCARAQAPSAAAAAGVPVHASTTSAVLAEPVLLEAEPPAGYALDLEKSATDAYAIEKAETAGGALRVSLLPLAVGKLPVRLVFDGPGGAVAESAPFSLDVAAPELKDPQLADIKPPQKARPLLWPWLAAALALAAGLWWWSRRREEELREAAAAAAAARPADEAALEDLDALGRSGLWTQARYREFYFRLTEIVRVYLERRFELPATRLTSAELNRQLKQAEVDRSVSARLKDLFDRADLVKFAKVAPEPAWGERDVELARALVRETTPPPPAAAEKAEARA